MTLRQKTLLIFALTLTTLVGSLWLLSRSVLLTGFARVEERDARTRMDQVLQLIGEERVTLAAAAQDYSQWDDAYHFMQTRDERFLAQLPRADTTSLRIHFVLLLDSSGRLVFGKGLDLDRKVDTSLDAPLLAVFTEGRVALANAGTTGLFRLPDGPALVAAHPILRSTGEGPALGLLVFGRRLDAWQWAKLTRETGLALSVTSPEAALPAGALASPEHPVEIVRRGPDALSAHALLVDGAGQPALVVTASLPRPIYAQARRSLEYLTGWVFMIGLLLGGAGLLLVETLTLARLRRLTAAARRIGTETALEARLPSAGTDELAILASALNGMLDALARARAEIQEGAARLRDVVEHSTNLFYSRDPQGALTYMSPQARSYLDVAPDAAMTWSGLVTANPANAEGVAAGRRAFETGERQPPYPLELQGPTGKRIQVEVNEAPVVRDGRTVAVVGALADVTARKGAETEQARLEEELRQAQKMEAVGRLAGGVAHDFNNLLGVIGGFSELLARDLGDGHPGLPRLQQIRKATERAAVLTRQLLAFGRKQLLQPTTLDLNAVVATLEPMLRRLIGEHITLVTEHAADAGLVSADAGQLEQVLTNLVMNARDAMPAGGRLAISTAAVVLGPGGPVAEAAPGPYVRLSVTDTGHGMDEATQARIFEPFFTTKELGKGTGLGLSTVFGIVKQSGGYVRVESAPARGCSFHVYLPSIPAPSPPPATRSEGIASGARGPETVLVAEDEPALRRMVEEVLTDGGYEVLAAPDPEQALAIAAAHAGTIHLLLTDVVMPGMSGREVAERLTSGRPQMRVLYMSGYTDEALGRHGILGQGLHFIQKPFAPGALLGRIREVLDAPRPDAS